MARIVADSSALILLAKCSLLGIVCGLFEVVVPTTVTVEVASEDLVRNYLDVALILQLIKFFQFSLDKEIIGCLPSHSHNSSKIRG